MADNYLEKRYEEVFGRNQAKKATRPTWPSLDSLLLKARSVRGYDRSRIVTEKELETIVSVNTRIPSARNQQGLRFRLVTAGPEAEAVLGAVKMGGALPELKLPFPGTEPEAFIVVCAAIPETKFLDIDLGISLQSMALKAADMKLNSLIICAFDKDKLTEALKLQLPPLAVLAVGKGAEQIQLLSISEDKDHSYYRKEGIHFVPKVQLSDLIIR